MNKNNEKTKFGFSLTDTFLRMGAFTLAEVLIVIGVIGVVAAITIPTLINTISEKAKEAQTEVIDNRLLTGFNQLNTMEDGFNGSKYSNTEDFVTQLAKYYKISAICGEDNLKDCYPYDKINYSGLSDNGKETLDKDIEISKISSVIDLGLSAKQGWMEPASFISAQGTPFIISFNKNCLLDNDKAMKTFPTECVSFLYDENGTSTPNKIGADIQNHGLKIGFILDSSLGVNIISHINPKRIKDYTDENGQPMTFAKAKAIKYRGEDQIRLNSSDNDYWVGAMYECYRAGGRLINEEELATIANNLYPDINVSGNDDITRVCTENNKKIIGTKKPIPKVLSGIGGTASYFWSSHESDVIYIRDREFGSLCTQRYYMVRTAGSYNAICVAE